jgi:hypothetical protein
MLVLLTTIVILLEEVSICVHVANFPNSGDCTKTVYFGTEVSEFQI